MPCSPFCSGLSLYRASEKQKEAMELAHVQYVRYSIYEITKSLVMKLLQNF